MNCEEKIENFIEKVSNFCNENNIGFKYCKELKSESYLFLFLKEGVIDTEESRRAREIIQIEFTEMELIKFPRPVLMKRVHDRLRNELNSSR